MNKQNTEQLKKELEEKFRNLIYVKSYNEGSGVFYEVKGCDDVFNFFLPHLISSQHDEIKREAFEGLKMPYLEIDSRSMSNLDMHNRNIQNLIISQINAKIDKLLTQSKEGGKDNE